MPSRTKDRRTSARPDRTGPGDAGGGAAGGPPGQGSPSLVPERGAGANARVVDLRDASSARGSLARREDRFESVPEGPRSPLRGLSGQTLGDSEWVVPTRSSCQPFASGRIPLDVGTRIDSLRHQPTPFRSVRERRPLRIAGGPVRNSRQDRARLVLTIIENPHARRRTLRGHHPSLSRPGISTTMGRSRPVGFSSASKSRSRRPRPLWPIGRPCGSTTAVAGPPPLRRARGRQNATCPVHWDMSQVSTSVSIGDVRRCEHG
jgi:hypothetical protein